METRDQLPLPPNRGFQVENLPAPLRAQANILLDIGLEIYDEIASLKTGEKLVYDIHYQKEADEENLFIDYIKEGAIIPPEQVGDIHILPFEVVMRAALVAFDPKNPSFRVFLRSRFDEDRAKEFADKITISKNPEIPSVLEISAKITKHPEALVRRLAELLTFTSRAIRE